ncbi:MAG TPA: DoxX family protein [Dongiaceae bacterium]|nr:DoxX family protein [Dongiaceae bacterium]
MTMTLQSRETPMTPILPRRVLSLYDRLGLLPLDILQLMARVSMAVIFWNSGQSKLANWPLTLQLFASEYKVPVLPPEIAAPLAASVELTTPVLLVLGLLTRVATLPMIGMTLVIQLFVYPESWPDHLTWMTFLLLLLTRGPGRLSVDHLARRHFENR